MHALAHNMGAFMFTLCADGADDASSTPGSISDDTRMDLEYILDGYHKEIVARYASYVLCIRNWFKGESVADLRSYLLSLDAFQSGSNLNSCCKLLSGVKDELEKASTICQIFDVINSCTSFINCELYECMVNDHHIDQGQEVLRYSEHLKNYFERHKISEFIEISPKLKKCTDKSKKLILKLDIKKTSKLAKVIEIKKEIARIFKILPSAIHLYTIDDGCVDVTFCLPRLIADLIFPPECEKTLSRKEVEKFHSLSVLWLECNTHRYYFNEGKDCMSMQKRWYACHV